MPKSDIYQQIDRRVRACDYLTVAQLFLQNNFLLDEPLKPADIKPRLLGHWGTCHGINVAYANLRAFFLPRPSDQPFPRPSAQPFSYTSVQPLARTSSQSLAQTEAYAPPRPSAHPTDFQFILGVGHGFPALQANLFLDGDLAAIDSLATRDQSGIAYLCKNFSWPGGFPSHASPLTPGVVCEGGELGYALGAAYGLALGHPEKTLAVLLGDGELETATALDSLNLVKFVGDHHYHGRVLPILHLNGYKISGPTLYGRKSERELAELIRGLGYTPTWITNDRPETFQDALRSTVAVPHPFYILRTEKGATGPTELKGEKIAGNYRAHQIPLPNAKTDPEELKLLTRWLESYHFRELFNPEEGFTYDR